MKLINLTEIEIPEIFYIFVNLTNLQTKHNLETTKCIVSGAFLDYIEEADEEFAGKYLKGTISTIFPNQQTNNNVTEQYLKGTLDYLPFTPNPKCSVNFVSMFNNHITSEYRTEFNCEIHRKYRFPLYPSRMSSCYAFGDYESCVKVSTLYGWDLSTVRKFKLVSHKDNRVAKVNMEIISLERYANGVSALDPKSQEYIWESYWSGKSEIQLELPTIEGRKNFKSGLIWEYLIEGILMIKE